MYRCAHLLSAPVASKRIELSLLLDMNLHTKNKFFSKCLRAQYFKRQFQKRDVMNDGFVSCVLSADWSLRIGTNSKTSTWTNQHQRQISRKRKISANINYGLFKWGHFSPDQCCHFFMVCIKLEASDIYLINQACGNNITQQCICNNFKNTETKQSSSKKGQKI